jgi:hypothetical protein
MPLVSCSVQQSLQVKLNYDRFKFQGLHSYNYQIELEHSDAEVKTLSETIDVRDLDLKEINKVLSLSPMTSAERA